MNECKDCMYWEPLKGDRGTCKKRAPHYDKNGQARWPSTFNNQWCGEHTLRRSELGGNTDNGEEN